MTETLSFVIKLSCVIFSVVSSSIELGGLLSPIPLTKSLVCLDTFGFLSSNTFLVAWVTASVANSVPISGPLGGSSGNLGGSSFFISVDNSVPGVSYCLPSSISLV